MHAQTPQKQNILFSYSSSPTALDYAALKKQQAKRFLMVRKLISYFICNQPKGVFMLKC